MATTLPSGFVVGDPQPLVAAALAALVTAQGHGDAASASDLAALGDALAERSGAVAIVALELLAGSGESSGDPVAALARLPAAQVVVIAGDRHHAALAGLVGATRASIVLRAAPAAAFADCLTALAVGERWIDPDVATAATRRPPGALALLTPRERDIVRLVTRGQRNRAIAGALAISEGTVKMHLHNIYAKMGIESRTQLATDARLRALQPAA